VGILTSLFSYQRILGDGQAIASQLLDYIDHWVNQKTANKLKELAKTFEGRVSVPKRP
jgi:hypothetical protein